MLAEASRAPSAGLTPTVELPSPGRPAERTGATGEVGVGWYSPEGRSDTVGVCALDLPQDTLVFGGCLHTRHPACCSGRVRADPS